MRHNIFDFCSLFGFPHGRSPTWKVTLVKAVKNQLYLLKRGRCSSENQDAGFMFLPVHFLPLFTVQYFVTDISIKHVCDICHIWPSFCVAPIPTASQPPISLALFSWLPFCLAPISCSFQSRPIPLASFLPRPNYLGLSSLQSDPILLAFFVSPQFPRPLLPLTRKSLTSRPAVILAFCLEEPRPVFFSSQQDPEGIQAEER